jgi:hypothetical protein
VLGENKRKKQLRMQRESENQTGKAAFHQENADRKRRKAKKGMTKGKKGRISPLTVLQARMPRRAEQNHRVC